MQYVILGIGKTAQTCLDFLQQRGDDVSVYDTRSSPPGIRDFQARFPGVSVTLGVDNFPAYCAADCLLLSPGVPLSLPWVSEQRRLGVEITSDIALFLSETSTPVIAITGTNGKSTVTKLATHVLTESGVMAKMGGNIGIPALSLLTTPAEVFVLELSSFQLDLLPPIAWDVACCLNLAPDHLDRYGSMDAYQKAKWRIYPQAKTSVINADDVASYPGSVNGCLLSFGKYPRSSYPELPPVMAHYHLLDSMHLACDGVAYAPIDILPMLGVHNALNALAATALLHYFNLSGAMVAQALKTFSPLPHRCELIACLEGVKYVNDSKATNVAAASVAIQSIGESMSGKIVWIGGGEAKESCFQALFEPLARYAKNILLIGRDAAMIANALGDIALNINNVHTLEKAVAQAKLIAKPGDVVLLSPACASFDQFKNFEQRGEHFGALI